MEYLPCLSYILKILRSHTTLNAFYIIMTSDDFVFITLGLILNGMLLNMEKI